jgi:hypothetical protein
MSLLGLRLKLRVGEKPRPAPAEVMENFLSAEVTPGEQGPIGFQLTFNVGRYGTADLPDYKLLRSEELKPLNRIILTVSFSVEEEVLVDGYITDQQLNPGNEPGTSTLTLTGEDVSVMMDLEQRAQAYPDRNSYDEIVDEVLDRDPYKNYFPKDLRKIRPAQEKPLSQNQSTEHQPRNSTDRGYIVDLASRVGHVFYVTPGPRVGSNGVFWGVPERDPNPQKPLSINMGPSTNVESIDFRFEALAPNKVTYRDKEEQTLDAPSSGRISLAETRAKPHKAVFFGSTGRLKAEQVRARAQVMVDESLYNVVTASGALDAVRYGGLLRPRGLVMLRGAGHTYNGTYYVKSVNHSIRKGEYKQRFTLTRDGTGSRERKV